MAHAPLRVRVRMRDHLAPRGRCGVSLRSFKTNVGHALSFLNINVNVNKQMHSIAARPSWPSKGQLVHRLSCWQSLTCRMAHAPLRVRVRMRDHLAPRGRCSVSLRSFKTNVGHALCFLNINVNVNKQMHLIATRPSWPYGAQLVHRLSCWQSLRITHERFLGSHGGRGCSVCVCFKQCCRMP
jgi:hypothetical protein